MPVVIKNLMGKPIFLYMNSGDTIRLSPGEVAQGINESEIQNNPKIDKLQKMRVISVEITGAKTASTGRRGAESKAPAAEVSRAEEPPEEKRGKSQ